MLATGAIGKPVKKKKVQPAEEEPVSGTSASPAARKKTAKPAAKPVEPEYDDYDDDDYYESSPPIPRNTRDPRHHLSCRIRILFIHGNYDRIFIVNGQRRYRHDITILALCLLVSALLYLLR